MRRIGVIALVLTFSCLLAIKAHAKPTAKVRIDELIVPAVAGPGGVPIRTIYAIRPTDGLNKHGKPGHIFQVRETAKIKSAAGALIRTLRAQFDLVLPLAPNASGVALVTVDAAWDARDESGAAVPAGAYIVTVCGEVVRLKLPHADDDGKDDEAADDDDDDKAADHDDDDDDDDEAADHDDDGDEAEDHHDGHGHDNGKDKDHGKKVHVIGSDCRSATVILRLANRVLAQALPASSLVGARIPAVADALNDSGLGVPGVTMRFARVVGVRGFEGGADSVDVVTGPAGRAETAFFPAFGENTLAVTLPAFPDVPAALRVTRGRADFRVSLSPAPPLRAGDPPDLTVTAIDADGVALADYTGAVRIVSSDPRSLFHDFTLVFSPADAGSITARFVAFFVTAGTHTLTATDLREPGFPAVLEGIEVRPGPEAQFLSVSGNGDAVLQTGETPPDSVTRVLDAFDNPIPDREVAAAVFRLGFLEALSSARTDAQGVARIPFAPFATAGTRLVRVEPPGSGLAPLDFSWIVAEVLATGTVGAAGGNVAAADGSTVVVPPGGVAQNVTFTIATVPSDDPDLPPLPAGTVGVGDGVDFGPANAPLTGTIQLGVAYPESALPPDASEEDLVLMRFDAATGTWVLAETAYHDAASDTFTVETDSLDGILFRFALLPPGVEQPPARNPSTGGGRDSVMLHSGEFLWGGTDLFVEGRGMDFAWTRTYRSGSLAQRGLGVGWDFNYNLRIEPLGEAGTADALLHEGGGRRERFGATRPPGQYYLLQFDARANAYRMQFRDGTRYDFAVRNGGTWHLSRMSDRNGNFLSFLYVPFNRGLVLGEIVDTMGRSIRVLRDRLGRIQGLRDFAGRTVAYAYDGSSNLIGAGGAESSFAGPGGAVAFGRKTTRYTYLSAKAGAALNHNLESITDPMLQTFLVNAYDAEDRVVRQQYGRADQFYTFEYGPTATLMTDRRRTPIQVAHNATSNSTRRTVAGRFTTTITYNADMEETSRQLPRGNRIERKYDEENGDPMAQGNLLAVRWVGFDNREAIERRFTYEPRFQKVKTARNGRGFTTTLIFDYETGRGSAGDVVEVRYATATIGRAAPQVATRRLGYDPFGRVVEEIDPKGFVDLYEYFSETDPDGDGVPSGAPADGRVLDARGGGYLARVLQDAEGLKLPTDMEYNAVGDVRTVMDARRLTTRYTVNALHQVVETIAPSPLEYRTAYLFDGNDNPVRTDVENRTEAGAADANGLLTTTMRHDVLNNVVLHSAEIDEGLTADTAMTYDPEENEIARRLPEGNRIERTYDARNLQESRTMGAGTSEASTTFFGLDGNGNVETVTDGNRHAHRSIFDGLDREARRLDPLGNETSFRYDANSNVVETASRDALRRLLAQTTNTYDERDRRVREERLFLNSDGAAVEDGLATSRFEWDENERLVGAFDDNGNGRLRFHDGADREVRQEDAVGDVVERVLDGNGNVQRLIERQLNRATGTVAVRETAHEHDALNRRTATVEDATAGGKNLRTVFRHDSRDNVALAVDAEGKATRRRFDGLDRLVETIFDEGGQAIPVRQEWDRNSRLTARMDGNGNRTENRYNARDLVTAILSADRTAKMVEYDGEANATRVQDQNGTVLRNEYDEADRLTGRKVLPGAGVIGATVERYEHDGLSRRTVAENFEGAARIARCEWGFDTLSMADRETQAVGGQAPRTVRCTFDGVGNRTGCLYPGSRGVVQSFDAANRLAVVKDGQGRVADFDWVGGRVARRTYGNGIAKEVTYDPLYRPTSIRHVDEVGNEKARFDYAYDGVHNRVFEKRAHDGEGDAYRYDGIYQVTGVKFGVPAADLDRARTWSSYATWRNKHEWAFDAVGNRETMDRDGVVETYNHSSGAYTPDPMNEYFEVGGLTQTHDENGNLTDDGTFTYEYSYKNELMRVTRKADAVVVGSYAYDAGGRRVERVQGKKQGVTQRYYWMGWQLLETRDDLDVVVESHVWGTGIDELLTSDLPGGRFFMHENAIGSVTQVSEDRTARFGAARIVEEYKYRDIYGKADFFSCVDSGSSRVCTSQSGTVIGNRHLFQGREWDSEAGFYQFRYRAQSPAVGRFSQRDPMGTSGDSLYNLYRFAANAPLRWVDPWGLDPVSPLCKWARERRDHWKSEAESAAEDINRFMRERMRGTQGPEAGSEREMWKRANNAVSMKKFWQNLVDKYCRDPQGDGGKPPPEPPGPGGGGVSTRQPEIRAPEPEPDPTPPGGVDGGDGDRPPITPAMYWEAVVRGTGKGLMVAVVILTPADEAVGLGYVVVRAARVLVGK